VQRVGGRAVPTKRADGGENIEGAEVLSSDEQGNIVASYHGKNPKEGKQKRTGGIGGGHGLRSNELLQVGDRGVPFGRP
jgi:hypothetical protein